MPLSSPHAPSRSRLSALPVRQLWARFGLLLLLAATGGIMFISKIEPQLATALRIAVMDTAAPALDALARPVETLDRAGASIASWIGVHAENVRLRTENAQLRAWQQAAQALQHENAQLRGLLQFKAEPATGSIAARVIAASGGPFAQNLIVTAGARDGVRIGMAAMNADGLIGRVEEVGTWSSRIMLLSDMNARLPVLLPESGDRGILAGNAGRNPDLLYLPDDATIAVGARLVTSGHGGIFPPHLPVGVVRQIDHGTVSVTLTADPAKTDYVRLIDFGLAGGGANPFNHKP